jgi:hypothetical protein
MNNISDKTLIWVGIAGIAGVVVAGISGVFKKSKNTMPELVVPADNTNYLTEFDKILPREKGGSRKNSKKRNRKSKKRR